MQKDGGEGTWKVPSISLSLLALKTETEGGDGFGTWLKTFQLIIKPNGLCNLLVTTLAAIVLCSGVFISCIKSIALHRGDFDIHVLWTR